MSSTSQNPKKKGQHIVIRSTVAEGQCKIVAEDANYPAIYSQVYGPASYDECERWIAENCVE
jgi:hypothetical protein